MDQNIRIITEQRIRDMESLIYLILDECQKRLLPTAEAHLLPPALFLCTSGADKSIKDVVRLFFDTWWIKYRVLDEDHLSSRIKNHLILLFGLKRDHCKSTIPVAESFEDSRFRKDVLLSCDKSILNSDKWRGECEKTSRDITCTIICDYLIGPNMSVR
jgi:hypothetical protein